MFFVSILRLFIDIVTCDFNKLNQFALKFDPQVVLYELLSPAQQLNDATQVPSSEITSTVNFIQFTIIYNRIYGYLGFATRLLWGD